MQGICSYSFSMNNNYETFIYYNHFLHVKKRAFSDLVIDLIMEEPNHEVFLMTIQLSKALLHNGNHEVYFLADSLVFEECRVFYYFQYPI